MNELGKKKKQCRKIVVHVVDPEILSMMDKSDLANYLLKGLNNSVKKGVVGWKLNTESRVLVGVDKDGDVIVHISTTLAKF